MKKLWRKIKAYFSGWPEGSEEKVEVKKVTTKKEKKPKGLKPKKKKKQAK